MKTTKKTLRYQAQLKFILSLLADEDQTASEICELTGLQTRAICGYLSVLAGKDGSPRMVRITGYDGRAPLYGLGSAPDKAPHCSRLADRPERVMVDIDPGDRRDAKVRERLAREAVESAVSKPQHWYSGLGL